MHILVAINFTPASDLALARAMQLARETGATLTAAHVPDAESPGADAARLLLERQLHACSADAAVSTTVRIASQQTPTAMAAIAAETSADLLVMGAHDPGRRRAGGFLASMAGRTLSAIGRPLLIAERAVEGPYGSAVIGVDFSLGSRTAIRAARRFAPGALLHLLHAYRVPFRSWLTGADYAEDYAYGERLALADFLAAELDMLKQQAETMVATNALVRTHLREGDPVLLLRALLAETAAPLAVVGTSGRTGISRLVLGSVAADLLDNPPADLLVTPVAIPAKA